MQEGAEVTDVSQESKEEKKVRKWCLHRWTTEKRVDLPDNTWILQQMCRRCGKFRAPLFWLDYSSRRVFINSENRISYVEPDK